MSILSLTGDSMRKTASCHGISSVKPAAFIARTAMERAMKTTVLTLSVLMLGVAVPALARTPLAQNSHITDSLVAGRVGDTIRKTCPSISARMITAYTKLKALEQFARDQGYTEDEVKVFMKDSGQKARIKALAAQYLAKAGVVEGNIESYCAAGRAEIEKGTLAGSLLRSSK